MLSDEQGRELDARVAQVVFGYEVKLVTAEERAKPDGYDLQDVERRYPWRSTLPSGDVVGGWGHLLPYSTSIEAAWTIVERLREIGYRAQVTNNRDDVPWVVVFSHETRYVTDYGSGVADTVSLAICKAAIAALEAHRATE